MSRADNQPAKWLADESVTRPELERFFSGVGSRMAMTTAKADVNLRELDQFFGGAERQMEQTEKLDRKEANGFNVFDLIKPDENKLSDVLKLLLDPKGGHGQGDLFLKLLFNQLGLGADAKLTKNATVLREAPTHGIEKYRRRMDVFVDAGVLLAIENKVDATDQTDQVKDYLDHLQYCTKRNGKRTVLIYLTPNGRRPKNFEAADLIAAKECGKLHCWGYHGELREWLESCRENCEARKIRDFITDFIAYIELELIRESQREDGQTDYEK